MIEAYGLTRRFGAFTAVTDLSLQVPNGSILALLGPNGAGKTTTVRMLAGLLAPTDGEARVAGYDIRRDPDAVRARVGLVTDAPGLFEQMKVPAYLDFFASIYGIPSDERKKRVQELLSFFELTDHCNEKMVGFSKGMKQKVALARALIHQPAVLFLDEPTSGLDPLIARNVRELIVNLKHSSRSIILCTHDLDEAGRPSAWPMKWRFCARAISSPAIHPPDCASAQQAASPYASNSLSPVPYPSLLCRLCPE